MRSWFALCLALAFTVPSGCQRLPDEDSDSGGPSNPNDDDTGGTFIPPDSDTGDEDDEGADETGSGSICDPVAQTGCAMDEKCTAILSGGEVTYACAADMPSLDPGDPCSAAHDSGLDGCPAGYVCLEDEGNNGLCAALCQNSGECPQGQCLPARESDIPYCADDCSPFGSLCPAPTACRRNGIRFSCKFLGENDVGGAGEACGIEDDAGCAPGLACVPGALIPGCTSDNCCTPLCDINEADPCASPSTCQSILMNAAPGFEEIGACFVPA